MTVDWLSAYADANVAVATWILVFLAIRGLNTWRGQVVAQERLERKKHARQLVSGMRELATDILALRIGRLPPSELSAGHAMIEGSIYKAKAPAYYLVMLDRAFQVVRRQRAEAMYLVPELAARRTAIDEFLSVAHTYREAFSQYFFSVNIAKDLELEALFSEELASIKTEMIVKAPTGEQDPFKERLMNKLELAIRLLDPYLVSDKS
jgi:hypothetical protein